MDMHAGEAIEDRRLLYWSLAVIAAVIAALVFARELDLEAGTIALFGGAVMMLIESWPLHREAQTESVTKAFHEVEWVTIFFFVGLFVVVGAVREAGLLDYLAARIVAATGGDLKLTAIATLWGAAILSALIDNIPFVATMIPLVKSMAPSLGGNAAILPLWWALALGACLGGNGTLIGASANLTVAGLAEKGGTPIRFFGFTKLAFPFMLISIAICHVYLLWRFF
jgi:Na+/H+ antiporter NhaD/arsenite permease-like protein